MRALLCSHAQILRCSLKLCLARYTTYNQTHIDTHTYTHLHTYTHTLQPLALEVQHVFLTFNFRNIGNLILRNVLTNYFSCRQTSIEFIGSELCDIKYYSNSIIIIIDNYNNYNYR